MAEIAPAVLAETPQDYAHDLEVATSLSDRIQLDMADGRFASNRTVNLAQIYWPENVRADLHIMYEQPLEHMPTFIALNPNLVIFHAESKGLEPANLKEACEQLHAAGIKAGLALLPETSVTSVAPYLSFLDHILIFTGELGHYGGRLNDKNGELLSKIGEAKQINPDLEAGVDGGINADNAAEVAAAGADVLNVGGFIQGSDDPQGAYAKLEQAIKATTTK